MVHVVQAATYKAQPVDIGLRVPPWPGLAPGGRNEQYKVVAILNYRRREKWYYFLSLMRDDPTHEPTWQSKQNLFNSYGTMTVTFADYIMKHNLYPALVIQDDNQENMVTLRQILVIARNSSVDEWFQRDELDILSSCQIFIESQSFLNWIVSN